MFDIGNLARRINLEFASAAERDKELLGGMGARSIVKAGIVFLATGFVAAAGCDQKHPQAAETPPPVVLVSRPVERTVTDHQVFTARTQAVQSVELKARVT